MEIVMTIGKVFLIAFGLVGVYVHYKQAFTEMEDFTE